MRLFIGFCLLTMVAACAQPRTSPYATAPLPQTPEYRSATPAGGTVYNNEDLARLFVRLTHGLESGEFRKDLQRFEGPVNVGMVGDGANAYQGFLRNFIAEIRDKAAMDISVGPPPHDLLIRLVPGEKLLGEIGIQCFVLFAQPTWEQFLAAPEDYTNLAVTQSGPQKQIGIMIPSTIEPFKIRECLLEEIPQALGPANDLYGLADTIFNDDDGHTWPTQLDYLMLKVLYDDRLESGLSQAQTFKVARAVLGDVNPEGQNAPNLPAIRQHTFLDWRGALQSLSVDGGVIDLHNIRRAAAEAERKAPGSAYHCTGDTMLAVTAGNAGAEDAGGLLEKAIQTCSSVHGPDDVRVGQLRLIRSLRHLNGERYRQARDDAMLALPIFVAHGLDDEIADVKFALVRAAIGLRDPSWTDLVPETAAWSAYVYGADHEFTDALSQ